MDKILTTQNSKDNSTKYSLIESKIEFEGKKISTYGIRIESLSSKDEKSEILDITTKKEKATALFYMIVKSEISPVILRDVAEDFIA